MFMFFGVTNSKSAMFRRGAGVVELATLERWYARKGIEGSNPSLSAKLRSKSELRLASHPIIHPDLPILQSHKSQNAELVG